MSTKPTVRWVGGAISRRALRCAAAVLVLLSGGAQPCLGSSSRGMASATPALKRGKEFPVPTFGTFPSGITAGPDVNLWFTEGSGNNIGRLTTSGLIAEFSIPTFDSKPNGITSGPRGDLWFAEMFGNKIGAFRAEP